MSISLIRFIPAALLIAGGIAMMSVAVLGVFRIRYVLNRLHSAAMGDSLGLLLVILGLIVLYGWSLSAVKLLLILALFWLTSPVCSHLLASLEVFTNENLSDECSILPLPAAEKPVAEEEEKK